MKKTLFMIIWLFLAIGSYAQIARTAKFQLIFPNRIDKSVFTENQKIKSYLVRYEGNKPISLSVYYFTINEQLKQEDEFYDLLFEGDLYMLKQRYGQIDLPDYPAVNMDFPIAKSDSSGSKYDYQVEVSVEKDHIIYDLMINHSQGTIYEIIPKAEYPGGSKKLLSDILAECNNLVPSQDTVFMFQGIVNRNGTMTNTELVVGPSSIFTESIKKWLQKPENLWQPEIQGGRQVKSRADVFIRIRNGHILSVSSSGWKRKKISP